MDSEYLLGIPEDVNPAEAAPVLCAGICSLDSYNVLCVDDPVIGTTVYRALRTAALLPGQWVAIVGASGGLGHL